MNYKVYQRGGGRGNGRYHFSQVLTFGQLISEIGLYKALKVRYLSDRDLIVNTYGTVILGCYYKIEKTNEPAGEQVYLPI
jgi:hypothetical protein